MLELNKSEQEFLDKVKELAKYKLKDDWFYSLVIPCIDTNIITPEKFVELDKDNKISLTTFGSYCFTLMRDDTRAECFREIACRLPKFKAIVDCYNLDDFKNLLWDKTFLEASEMYSIIAEFITHQAFWDVKMGDVVLIKGSIA